MQILKITFLCFVLTLVSSFAFKNESNRTESYQKFLSKFDKVDITKTLRLDGHRIWSVQKTDRFLSSEFQDFIPTIGIGLGDRFGGYATHEAEVLAQQTTDFDILFYSLAEYYYPVVKSYYLAVYNKKGEMQSQYQLASADDASFAEISFSKDLKVQAKQFKIKDNQNEIKSLEIVEITPNGQIQAVNYKSAEELTEEEKIAQE